MNEILKILFNTFICYFVLIILMKIMGKREIGQLSLFDLLIILTIADIMVVGIENFDNSLWYCLIPMVFLTLLQKVLAFISLKSRKVREIMDGNERIIIFKGIIQMDAMKKEKYNMDDLLIQLRIRNIRSITEVEYGILEINGQLTVFTYAENIDDICPIPIILCGQINRKLMELLHLKQEWLDGELERLEIKDINNILSANLKKNKLLVYLSPNDRKKSTSKE